MRPAVTAYIGLGANLGSARDAVRQAMDDIASLADSTVTARSALYSSAPVDSSGPDYLNAVVAVTTRLTAPALLAQLQDLELRAGRERPYANAPRTLDLDLLLFGSATIDSATLQLPHPRMATRAFVLLPLAEIAPALVPSAWLQAVQGQCISKEAA